MFKSKHSGYDAAGCRVLPFGGSKSQDTSTSNRVTDMSQVTTNNVYDYDLSTTNQNSNNTTASFWTDSSNSNNTTNNSTTNANFWTDSSTTTSNSNNSTTNASFWTDSSTTTSNSNNSTTNASFWTDSSTKNTTTTSNSNNSSIWSDSSTRDSNNTTITTNYTTVDTGTRITNTLDGGAISGIAGVAADAGKNALEQVKQAFGLASTVASSVVAGANVAQANAYDYADGLFHASLEAVNDADTRAYDAWDRAAMMQANATATVQDAYADAKGTTESQQKLMLAVVAVAGVAVVASAMRKG